MGIVAVITLFWAHPVIRMKRPLQQGSGWRHGERKNARRRKKHFHSFDGHLSGHFSAYLIKRDPNGYKYHNGHLELPKTVECQNIHFRDMGGARSIGPGTYCWSKPNQPMKRNWRYNVNRIDKLFRFQPGRPPRTENLDRRHFRGVTRWAVSTDSEVISNIDPQKSVVRKVNEAAEMLTPAIWNKPAFRVTALILGSAAVAKVVPFAGYLHLLAFGAW